MYLRVLKPSSETFFEIVGRSSLNNLIGIDKVNALMGYVPPDMGISLFVDIAYIYLDLIFLGKRNTRTFITPSDQQLYFKMVIPVTKPLFGFV